MLQYALPEALRQPIWAVATDATYRVQRMSYALVAVSAVIHRKVAGSWIRTPWPLVVGCFPGSESHEIYWELLTIFRPELDRRGMPGPEQLHSDWFPGLSRIWRGFFPKGRGAAQGIEHCLRAMRKNHRQGTSQAAGVLPRRRRGRGRGRGRGHHERGPEDDVRPVPHLKHRPLNVFLAPIPPEAH